KIIMGEEEPVNTVSKTDSNGNSTLEKTLDDTNEKKDCEPKGGKSLENNAVKDLKEDDIKEVEVDKKADGEEELEMEEDKKAD
ncbi:myb-like protein X-like, partial [Trifolium medium]|nr:myb-like protein X-like [Trifolium medium]